MVPPQKKKLGFFNNKWKLQGESKKTGISKILNFVWGPLKCTKLNFYPMHIFSPLRDIWFNGITMDFSFKNEWVIAIWKFWDPSFFWLTLYIYKWHVDDRSLPNPLHTLYLSFTISFVIFYLSQKHIKFLYALPLMFKAKSESESLCVCSDQFCTDGLDWTANKCDPRDTGAPLMMVENER